MSQPSDVPTAVTAPRLTSLSHGAGCACKLSLDELTSVLADTSLASTPIVVTDAIAGRGLDRLVATRAGTVVTGLLGPGALEVGEKVAVLGSDAVTGLLGSPPGHPLEHADLRSLRPARRRGCHV